MMLLTKEQQTEKIQAKLAELLSPMAAKALFSCYIWKKDRFTLRKTAPSRLKAPHAWAAWQGMHVAQVGQGTIGGLMLSDEDTRQVWDEVSDMHIKFIQGKLSAKC